MFETKLCLILVVLLATAMAGLEDVNGKKMEKNLTLLLTVLYLQ